MCMECTVSTWEVCGKPVGSVWEAPRKCVGSAPEVLARAVLEVVESARAGTQSRD